MERREIDELNFTKLDGLVVAVVADAANGKTLMVGFMNRAAVEATLERRRVVFWSRSRRTLWEKGETSGNTLHLVDIKRDCDSDALLVTARPVGPTCHTGSYSCFGLDDARGAEFIQELFELIRRRQADPPSGSYTASLLADGTERILGKIEEESGEVINAVRNETKQRLVEESADLLYHLLVLLADQGSDIADVVAELIKRRR